jgi:hypothetical protein
MLRSDAGWALRLRELPPVWPRRVAEPEPAGQRWLRSPEPFEDRGAFEPYPGAAVLEDLSPGQDETAALRILARYTVVRVVALASTGLLAGPKLRSERRVALEHLALLPAHDWERHALERLAELCRETPAPVLASAALAAAECAAKRGHRMGAFALYRAGYEIARDRRWWADAGHAAAGIARLSALAELPYSVRLWRWRARVTERRALRERELELELEAHAREQLQRQAASEPGASPAERPTEHTGSAAGGVTAERPTEHTGSAAGGVTRCDA